MAFQSAAIWGIHYSSSEQAVGPLQPLLTFYDFSLPEVQSWKPHHGIMHYLLEKVSSRINICPSCVCFRALQELKFYFTI